MQAVPSVGISTGGLAVAVVELSYALQNCGAQVVVFTSDSVTAGNARAHRAGLSASDLPKRADKLDVRAYRARRPYRWRFAPEIGRAFRSTVQDYDVVHIHGIWSYIAFAAWRAARRAKVPYVVSTHGMLHPYLMQRGRPQKAIASRLWIKKMLEGAAAIHCTTTIERDHISTFAPLTSRVVIANGMHIDDFSVRPDGQQFRDNYLGGSRSPLIMNHGRISYKKGLDILVDAMGAIRAVVPEARLALVGPDDEGLGARLKSQAHELGIREAVVFTGELTGHDLLTALSAADVWALPSHTENFGIAVAEAMASGCPTVVSSAVNIAPEAHAAGAVAMTGVDRDSTAATIIELLEKPDLRVRLGAEGQRFVARYDWTVVADAYVQLYRGIVDGCPRNL
jgi:glycosyltransferase involved in cell wall biosynthesis